MPRPPRRALTAVLALVAGLAAGCAGTTRRDVFAAYQAGMQDRGFLRTDTRPADAPFSNADLAEHFRRIAFFDYPGDREHLAKPLTRWEGPVRYTVLGGAADRPAIGGLMAHLAALTDLSIAEAPPGDANFLIMVLDEAAQRAVVDSFDDAAMRAVFNEFLGAVFDCGGIARWSKDDPVIHKALVYLHGDLAGLYRELCFHEEIAQSLGLFNDDPAVRPSIFNDDEEFALLTAHDEYLLRILYDPRLKPGMTPGEAMPLVRRIIGELRPGA